MATATLVGACTLTNSGVPPVPRQFHYPVAAVLSPDSRWLYVVNSDFDLAYNGGMVNPISLDLVYADPLLGRDRARWRQTPPPQIETQYIPPGFSVQVNPFATSAGIRVTCDATGTRCVGDRMYITVRGDGSLTWIDLAGSTLSCGSSAGGLCDAAHRLGPTPSGRRTLSLPPLPLALSVDPDGFIVVAHQESPTAHASLFYDPPDGRSHAPVLAHWIANLPPNLAGVFRVNPTSASVGNPPAWWMLSRSGPTVSHLRAHVPTQFDPAADDTQSYLFDTHDDVLVGLATDAGARSMVRDPCNPSRAYVITRSEPPDANTATMSPDEILRLDISNPDVPIVMDLIDLPPAALGSLGGPSNMIVIPHQGDSVATTGCGTGPTLAYTVSYDARQLYVINVDDWTEADQIRTQRGPHVPVFDAINQVIYLVDFAAMCIEVIDVRDGSPTRHQAVFTIGIPQAPLQM